MGLDNSHLLVIKIGMLRLYHDPVTPPSRHKHPFNHLSPHPVTRLPRIWCPRAACHCLGSVCYSHTGFPKVWWWTFKSNIGAPFTVRDTQRHLNVSPIHEALNESSNMVRDSHLIRAAQVFRYSRLSLIANPGMGPSPSLTSDPYLYFSVKRVSSFSLPGAFEPIIETLKTVRNIVSPPVLT